MILGLCKNETLPENFKEVLEIYTKEGYRVIALASKVLADDFNYRKSQTVQRLEIECQLRFLGLLVLENKLKPVSSEIIDTLNSCDIRTIMATGDNVLTAISVAR